MFIAIATFLGILALVVLPYWMLVVRSEQDDSRKLRKRMKIGGATKVARPDLIQEDQPLSRLSGLESILLKADFIARPLREKLLQSGLDTTVGVIVLASVLSGLLAWTLTYWVTGWFLVATPIAIGASMMPYLYVKVTASRRIRKFEEQFPEATELLARSLRAGHAFTTGLSMVAEELPEPVGAEFRLVYDRQAFGMPLAEALRDMAQRVPLLDARFFVTAVLTQRESGGNLSEVLDNLARLMRERFTVRREVRTLSAHGRITGWVLTCLTPVLALILFFIAPQHMMLLITDPLGRFMVAAAALLQVVGVFAIRRIIDIEI